MIRRSAVLLVPLFVAAVALEAAAQPLVFVVRHAERADGTSGGSVMMASDPELSDAGRARADALAALLRDAGITAIFATEFKRTQQTAAPLARALKIDPTLVSSRDTGKLAELVRQSKGAVLVVGHSNTVPEILAALGAKTPVTIGDSEFDNLFVVSPGGSPGAEARMARLRLR